MHDSLAEMCGFSNNDLLEEGSKLSFQVYVQLMVDRIKDEVWMHSEVCNVIENDMCL